jgi:Leucine-rich repeat (LRR) protein
MKNQNATKAAEWLNRIQEKIAEVQEMIQEEISSDVLNQNWVEIPDKNFRRFLKETYPNSFNSQDMMNTTCSEVLTARMMACSYESIASLQGIQYFKGLDSLECNNNQLTSLPALPSGLTYLDCDNNQLTSLPALPSGLTSLDCHQNQLTSLPALPSGLKYYNGQGNKY